MMRCENRVRQAVLAVCAVVLIMPYPTPAQETQKPNIQSYRIESPFQQNSTTIRILLPDDFDTEKTYKVLYVLPVVENDKRKYGGGLMEIVKHDFHNIHQLICVAPEFTSIPWYVYETIRKHRWDSGWIPLAVEFLVKD
jgi:hypothetical protein